MTNQDSFDRIISYFHALANRPFVRKDKAFEPYDKLVITPAAFRSYSCPGDCGACCMKCSLVWDVDNGLPHIQPFPQTVNGITEDFWMDNQKSHSGAKCQYLGRDARCSIYSLRPLPCRFELFKFIHYVSRNQAYARVALPGRGWALTRVTGEKKNACQILPYDRTMTMSHVADLTILARWMDRFEIKHDTAQVIKYLLTGPHSLPCIINRHESQRRIGDE